MKTGLSIALVSFVLAGCSDEYTDIRGQFIYGCVQGGTPKSLCTCTFEKLAEKYPAQALNELNTSGKALPDSFMRDVMQFALECKED